jgi:hypothetical protein
MLGVVLVAVAMAQLNRDDRDDVVAQAVEVKTFGGWAFPVQAPTAFSDTYGAPRMVGTEFEHVHQGVDIFAERGSPVVAISDGRVYSVGTARLGGNRLWLKDRSGYCYYYAHLESFTAVEGQVVKAGEQLGTVGSAGNEAGTPPMLHFEMHPNCTGPTNPNALLRVLESLSTPAARLTNVEGIMVAEAAAPDLRRLLQAARRDGFGFSGGGYRDPSQQIALRKEHCGTTPEAVFLAPAASCMPPTARPGDNAHHLGTGVDFTHAGRAVSTGSPAHRWLTKHAKGYGFTGNTDEPWHWDWRR